MVPWCIDDVLHVSNKNDQFHSYELENKDSTVLYICSIRRYPISIRCWWQIGHSTLHGIRVDFYSYHRRIPVFPVAMSHYLHMVFLSYSLFDLSRDQSSRGDIVLSCLSSAKKFNLSYNFWMVSIRALIFHMSVPCDKPFKRVLNTLTFTLVFDSLIKNFNLGYNFWMICTRALNSISLECSL
jgi:hypothetical protein